MIITTNTAAQKNVTNVRLFVMFVLLVLSSTGVFGQNTTTPTQVLVSNETTVSIAAENAVASMEFAVWFMGVKKTSSDAASTSAAFGKKQLINSGIKTNNMLIRTFLKKVSTQENSVA